MFGDPVLNDMGWERCRLKDISVEKLAYGSGASAIEFSQFACGIVIKLWRNSLKSSII